MKTKAIISIIVLLLIIAGLFLIFRNFPYISKIRQITTKVKTSKLPETVRYRNFKKFWKKMYAGLRQEKTSYSLRPLYNDKSNKIETYDLTLTSYDGLKIKGYFSIPYGVEGKKYPGALLIHGYGSYGTPGWAHFFAKRGYAAVSIDLRGHGRSRGVYNPGFPGLMTNGILHVRTFSMVKVIMDSLATLKFLEHYKDVNHNLIFVTGGSMGGGLSLIDAAIDRHVVAAAGDVPFLADIPLQMPPAKMGPYMEVKALLKKHPEDKAKVMRSLYYVDVMNFARWIKVPVLVGVGMKDEDCPPVGTFAVYKIIKSKKQLFIAKNSGHVVLPGWNGEVFKFFAPYAPVAHNNGKKTVSDKEKRKIL